MRIEESAPAVVRRSETIAAPPGVVWALLAAIDDWPSWQEEVQRAQLSGPLGPGSAFRWKAGPIPITSTLEEVEPERAIGWSGGSLGVRARHRIVLEPAENDVTTVRSEESWSGLPVRLLTGPARKRLAAGVEGMLRDLKRAAER